MKTLTMKIMKTRYLCILWVAVVVWGCLAGLVTTRVMAQPAAPQSAESATPTPSPDVDRTLELSAPAAAALTPPQQWCLERGGQANLVLYDKTICDCLTETHAIVVASADSWFQAVGKSLYLAVATGKSPGILMLDETGQPHSPAFLQLKAVLSYFDLPVTLWQLGVVSHNLPRPTSPPSSSSREQPNPPESEFLLNEAPLE
jgi:hypothetical protein